MSWNENTIALLCMGTAAILQHTALLSTRPSLYSAVGVGTIFSAVQAWFCLSTAVSTCAALHDAAGVDAGIFSADVGTDTVRYNAVATYS